MPTVSLRDTGIQLGRTTGQTVSLKTLRLNGYTRTFASDGYKRVNPFEVARNHADDPNSGSSNYSLGAWVGYQQSYCAPGSNLAYTIGYGSISVSWSKPSGYLDSLCDQYLYAKDTGQTVVNSTALAVNPFSSPSQSQGLGDGTAASVNLASYSGRYVALGVKSRWYDSVTTYEANDNGAYSGASGQQLLTGAGVGILVRAYNTVPGTVSAVQLTDPNSCYVGQNVTLRVSFSMEGPSTGRLEEQVNGGSWTVVTTISAGSSSIDLSRASGSNYKYRLRYNSVSPDQWSTMSGTVSAVCNLI